MHSVKKNFLDMIPVRNVAEFTHDGLKTTLLIPRFKSEWMLKWLVPPSRSKYLRVHLDELGSQVWALIDGARNCGEICDLLGNSLPDQADPDDTAVSVTTFLRQLYKNRIIVFK